MAMTDLIARVNRILDGLVGCQIEFQPASTLAHSQWDQTALYLLRDDSMGAKPPYVENTVDGSFGFPVNMHGAFAGLAVVRGWAGGRTTQLINLAELLTIALEHGIAQEERRERLRMIEERLRLMQEDSNVIPLRPVRYGKALQVIEPEMVPPQQTSPITEMPLLINVDPGFPLHRVAIEIHHLSKRWAFVSIEDLPSDILNSQENLKALGGITLFIPDLNKLSAAQQMKLAEYLVTKPGADMPHVIAGRIETAEETSETKVLPHLLSLFCVSHLEWNEKTPEQVTRELIDASLRHILERTRETHAHGKNFIPFHIQYFDPNQPYSH